MDSNASPHGIDVSKTQLCGLTRWYATRRCFPPGGGKCFGGWWENKTCFERQPQYEERLGGHVHHTSNWRVIFGGENMAHPLP